MASGQSCLETSKGEESLNYQHVAEQLLVYATTLECTAHSVQQLPHKVALTNSSCTIAIPADKVGDIVRHKADVCEAHIIAWCQDLCFSAKHNNKNRCKMHKRKSRHPQLTQPIRVSNVDRMHSSDPAGKGWRQWGAYCFQDIQAPKALQESKNHRKPKQKSLLSNFAIASKRPEKTVKLC
jgi:hypothetical protein